MREPGDPEHTCTLGCNCIYSAWHDLANQLHHLTNTPPDPEPDPEPAPADPARGRQGATGVRA